MAQLRVVPDLAPEPCEHREIQTMVFAAGSGPLEDHVAGWACAACRAWMVTKADLIAANAAEARVRKALDALMRSDPWDFEGIGLWRCYACWEPFRGTVAPTISTPNHGASCGWVIGRAALGGA